MPEADTPSRPPRALAVALVLLAGLALPATTLWDVVLSDSYTLILKARMLSWWELFLPQQEEVINPYYRPLFILLQGWIDRAGGADIGWRTLTVALHALAALALLRVGRVVGLRAGVVLVGVLLFLLVPGNVFTAAWPVVGYWILAAAATYLAIAALIRFRSEGGTRHAVAALGWTAVGLASAETGYHLVAFGLLLLVFPPAADHRAGGRRRAAGAWLAITVLCLLHLSILEAGAQGLAGSSPIDRLLRAARFAPRFWLGALGGDHWVGDPRFAALAAVLILLGLRQSGRAALFLLLFALVAPLPFAVLGHSDRYAYFTAGPVCLLLATVLLEGLPRLLCGTSTGRGPRVAPRVAAGLAMFLVVLFAMLGVFQSSQRLAEVRAAAARTEQLDRGLDAVLPEVRDLEQVQFLNMPSMLRWNLFWKLGIDTWEGYRAASANLALQAYFTTDHVWFGQPQALPFARRVVQCEDDRFVLRPPDQPFGERRLQPFVFLAGGVEVVPRPEKLPGGRRGELLYEDLLLARARTLRNPEERVLLEAAIPGLEGVLPREQLSYRIERVAGSRPSPEEIRIQGIRLNWRLVADLDLPRPGLLVVITYFAVDDPVNRVSGDRGRGCSQIEALLDGTPSAVTPVFYHSSGILVPAGRHQVIVRQRPVAGNPVSPTEQGAGSALRHP